MTVAPPIAPVLGRIQAITARFQPVAPSAASDRAAAVSAALAARSSGFDAVLSDALGTGAGGTDAAASLLGGRGSASGSGALDLTSVLRSLTGSTGATGAAGSAAIDLRTGARSTGPDGNDVVAAATRYLGVPYQWGGTDPASGLDCSGLVQRAYADVGVPLPRVSYDQAKVGTPVASIDQARPGDLVAFGQPVDHIAIYVGDGKILQAPRRGEVVSVSEIRRPIAAIRRVLPDPTAGVGATSGAVAGANGATASGAAPIPGSEPFAELFATVGARHGVDPRLLAAVAKVESGFNPSATSPAGAQGLMQLMPATARALGVDPRDPAQAVDGAARYLRTQLRDFGSVDKALAAYNAGPGAVRRFGGIPPYAETRSYVTKVTALLQGGSSIRTVNGA